jgi:signal transduction histidine kinase
LSEEDATARIADLEREVRALERRVEREKRARQAAEAQVEERTRELFITNRELRKLTASLEENQHALEDARDLAIKASGAKSRFLANMSHELRTPLNAIIGYTELLGEELEEVGIRELDEILARVQGSSHHLLQLVNDILDLSRIEAGRVTLHPTEINLPLMVSDLEALAEPLVRINDNTFEVELREPLPLVISHDATKLKQVLINLISNAAKFSSEGSVKLTIASGRENIVTFAVSDTGPGIPESKLASIFNAFHQLEGSSSNPMGSSGLGLAITRELCKLMGGDVTVSSKLGRGSTFTVTLPGSLRDSLTAHIAQT